MNIVSTRLCSVMRRGLFYLVEEDVVEVGVEEELDLEVLLKVSDELELEGELVVDDDTVVVETVVEDAAAAEEDEDPVDEAEVDPDALEVVPVPPVISNCWL